jgi:hypothetical protein
MVDKSDRYVRRHALYFLQLRVFKTHFYTLKGLTVRVASYKGHCFHYKTYKMKLE